MKSRKILLAAVLAVALVLGITFASCNGTGAGGGGGGGGGGSSSSNLAGTTWKCTESGGLAITSILTFTSSSRVMLEVDFLVTLTYNGTYSVSGNTLYVTWDAGYDGSGTFSISGNRLTDADGNVFIKQ